LSYALTSRLLDTSDGSELIEANFGQIHYFRNREVQLPGVAPQTNTFSDVVGNLTFNLNDQWSASYDQQWNTYTRQTDVGAVGLEYHPGYRQVLNLSYRYNRNLGVNNSNLVLKQTDLSFAWPLSEHWRMVGRWNYDITNHITLEDFAGFEYENCCWVFQIVQRHYITQSVAVTNPSTVQSNRSIFLQLQFKGLATIGKRLDDFLQNGILGYSDTQPQ
jgi:LPS-assembly protein